MTDHQAIQGLTTAQAQAQQKAGLGNQKPSGDGNSIGKILLSNLFTWFNILNFLLALALIAVGSYRNLLFMGVVVSNLLIGTFQEIRAKKTVDRLTLLSEAPYEVKRDGQWVKLPSDELVKEDVVRFPMGSQVCADALIVQGSGAADESLLTGESEPVQKNEGDELLSGSFITEGNVQARLIKVGGQSYAGQLVQSARKVKAVRSRLMEDMKRLIRLVSAALIPLGILLLLKQTLLNHLPLAQAVPPTVAAMLGMIPEGLMLLTSMALMVGVVRLGAQKTLVQELYGIENLARVDVLCVDKTGTITKGSFTVEKILPLAKRDEAQLKETLGHFMAATEDDNQTNRSLKERFYSPDHQKVTARIPFSSARKYSALTFEGEGTYALGAPEFIMGERLSPSLREQTEALALEGYRLLLLAFSEAPAVDRELPEDIEPLALLVLSDIIREDFADTANYLLREGVDIKVISGDNPRTVAEVARRAGLAGADLWVDAGTLDSDEKLEKAAKRYTVFGRVKPDQKKALVRALQAQGRTVAMMGDGVNDVPALKACDCAIAMAGGSDAARRVSQLTLLNENFSALPQVILEGRRVINNITRSASLFLVKTCFSCLLSTLMLLLPFHYPFQPIQMTLIGAFTVGIPSFLLALEPNKERVKGQFLRTILSNALPGALTNVLLLSAAFLLSKPLGFDAKTLSTLCVYLAAVTGIHVLLATCLPLSFLRLVLVSAMSLGILLAVLILPGVFLLVPLPASGYLILAVGVAIAPVLLWLMRGILSRVLKVPLPRQLRA